MRHKTARALMSGVIGAILMASGAGPASADSYCFTFTTQVAGATITDGTSCTGSLDIPSTVRSAGSTYTVISIADRAFAGSTGLTAVTIPSTITQVLWGTFQSSSVASVGLPSSIIEVQPYAFENTPNLTAIALPSGLLSIGQYAFHKSGLRSVAIPSSVSEIGLCAFQDAAALASVTLPDTGSVSIGNTAFHGTSLTGPLNIADGVTRIGSLAFADLAGVTSVRIGTHVTSVDDMAFSGDSGLASVSFAAGNLARIGDDAFMGTALTSVALPSSLVTLGARAFANLPTLTSVTLNEGLVRIFPGAFYSTGITSLAIPSTVTSIGETAWTNCPHLTSVTVSPLNTTFSADPAGIVYRETVEYNPRTHVLTHHKMLVAYPAGQSGTYTFPDSVVATDSGAFEGAQGLTSITIPSTSTLVGGVSCDAVSTTGVTAIYYAPNLPWASQYRYTTCAPLPVVKVRIMAPAYNAGLAVAGRLATRRTVSVTVGTWASDVPTTYTYAWFVCRLKVPSGSLSVRRSAACREVSGATGSVVRVPLAARGRYVVARVTAANQFGQSVRFVGGARRVA